MGSATGKKHTHTHTHTQSSNETKPNPLVDKGSSSGCLGLVDIRRAEQELPVQIAWINCVHVNDVNVSEPRECQALENVASESTCAAAMSE